MEVLVRARRAGERPPVPLPNRLWGLPVAIHLAALAAVLLLLLPLVGWSASFSADEGAAIVQAQSLSRGDGWIVEHPLPQVDPGGRAYPLELSEWGDKGAAPFAKHPLYAAVLAGADRLGGHLAMVLLSMAGTVAAAGIGAELARRVHTSLARPAVWVLGLGSPLLFDGYLVMAHTLGAAIAGLAVLAALVALERRSRLAAMAVVPCIAAGVLLRTEAVLLALGLAAGALVASRTGVRWPGPAVAGSAVAGAVLGRLIEKAWIQSIVGSPVAAPPRPTAAGAASEGFLADRVTAFVLTWLRPAYQGSSPVVALALLVMALALITAVWAARRRPGDNKPVLVRSGAAALAAAVAVFVAPRNLVPGLLVAFPVGLAGAVALRREAFSSVAARLCSVTFAGFAAGVLATQYAIGGGTEWGGRYFAIGLPVVVPVLLLALRSLAATLDASVARRSGAALATCAVALSAMGLTSMRATHRFTDDLMRTVTAAAASTGEAPVLVTTSPLMPRLAWATFTGQRWLLTGPEELPDLLGRLEDAGVERLALVTRDLRRDASHLPLGVEVVASEGRGDGRGWQVRVLSTVG